MWGSFEGGWRIFGRGGEMGVILTFHNGKYGYSRFCSPPALCCAKRKGVSHTFYNSDLKKIYKTSIFLGNHRKWCVNHFRLRGEWGTWHFQIVLMKNPLLPTSTMLVKIMYVPESQIYIFPFDVLAYIHDILQDCLLC